jgi:hypothetical protein
MTKPKWKKADGIEGRVTEHKNGGIEIDLCCPTCKEPITRTSVKYGMDCANRCGEKAQIKRLGYDPMKRLLSDLKGMLECYND